MRIRPSQGGGIVSISDERGERLLESKSWYRVDADLNYTSEESAEPSNTGPRGEDTEEGSDEAHRASEDEPTPASEDNASEHTAAEIRAWAKDNYDGDVPSRGKLPDAVREAFNRSFN